MPPRSLVAARRLSWLLALALAPLGCPATRAEQAPEAAPSATAAAPPVTSAAGDAPPAGDARPAGDLLLSAVGDCTLGGEYALMRAAGSFVSELEARGGDLRYPFSGVIDVLSKDDITIANLETPLSTRAPVGNKRFVFRGEPGYARMLVEGSVEVVSVANNHTYDLGHAGFADTLKALEAHDVGAFGAGLVDRRTLKGIEVVNLGYTGGDPDAVIKGMVRAVQSNKRPDNLVVVSFHWGGEGVNHPNDAQLRLGRAAVDAGADLVLGHHPHVIQGIERYQGRDIVYSLGNFVFGGHSNPDDKDSIIYQATFALRDGRVAPTGSWALPVRISSVTTRNDYRPVLLEGAEKERVLGRLRDYSEALARQAEAGKRR